MPDSTNEDDHHRKNANMEDSTMTIDFLRARLLSERSVSSSARQRADELAKRVVELEEQLKIASLQRKKAEKATAGLLAILEANGISDASDEEYDSRSDQDRSISDSKFDKNSEEEDEASPNENVRASLSGRSLSWKSGKNSPISTDKRIYSQRRHSSSSLVSSGSSSAQRTAKSCRQIRHSETRSAVEGIQSDTDILAARNNEEPACTECFPKPLETGAGTWRVVSEDCKEKDLVDNTEKNADSNCFKDMESALEHQARLIGKYQSEENAQREWEEKFAESNSCTPDSLDAGNQSDMTEDRDEIKASVPPSTYQIQSTGVPADARFPKKDPKGQSPIPEFTFSKSKDENDEQESVPSSQNSSRVESRSNLQKGTEASESMKELSMVPHEISSNVTSVLEALNRAKMSLEQDLNKSPSVEGGRAISQPPPPSQELAVQHPKGLFRVPTDYPTAPDRAISHMQPNLSTDPYLSVQPYRYPDFRTSSLERSLHSSSGYPYLEPRLISSLPSGFDPRLGMDVSTSDRSLDTGRSTYHDRRLTSTTSFDPGLDLGVPSSGISSYLDHRSSSVTSPLFTRFDPALNLGLPSSGISPYLDPRLSSVTSPPSLRFDPALNIGALYSGRSPYLGHDSSTNLPSRNLERNLDLGTYSDRYNTTYQDPRSSAATGSRYSNDPAQLARQSDNRIVTSREDGTMPPASSSSSTSAAAAATQFSFYNQDNSNAPNMYR